jgi:hypothetical protein
MEAGSRRESVCYYCGPPEDKDSEETGMDPQTGFVFLFFQKKRALKKRFA